MGPGILGNHYFVHTDVMVIYKVVSYSQHTVGTVLHIVLLVDIALGQLPLAKNVHDLVLDNHLFESMIVGMEPVVEMYAALVEVDKIVGGTFDANRSEERRMSR